MSTLTTSFLPSLEKENSVFVYTTRRGGHSKKSQSIVPVIALVANIIFIIIIHRDFACLATKFVSR